MTDTTKCDADPSTPVPRVTLRLLTEADLGMLHEWLNRRHIVEWWGGEEARPSVEEVRRDYLPSVLAGEGVTPYIAMIGNEPIGYAQSYVAMAPSPARLKRRMRCGVTE